MHSKSELPYIIDIDTLLLSSLLLLMLLLLLLLLLLSSLLCYCYYHILIVIIMRGAQCRFARHGGVRLPSDSQNGRRGTAQAAGTGRARGK